MAFAFLVRTPIRIISKFLQIPPFMKDSYAYKLKILTILVSKRGQQDNSCEILVEFFKILIRKTDNIAYCFYTTARLKKYHSNTQGGMASSFSTKL